MGLCQPFNLSHRARKRLLFGQTHPANIEGRNLTVVEGIQGHFGIISNRRKLGQQPFGACFWYDNRFFPGKIQINIIIPVHGSGVLELDIEDGDGFGCLRLPTLDLEGNSQTSMLLQINEPYFQGDG